MGMLLSMVMVFCNYVNVEWMIIGFMALAFFGKGIGALGWAVMADTAPKEISGLSGGLFNMFGNISGIVTPIAIGYIVGTTGSFNGALIYVGVHALDRGSELPGAGGRYQAYRAENLSRGNDDDDTIEPPLLPI